MNVAADEKTEKATPKRRQDERKKEMYFRATMSSPSVLCWYCLIP